jgi:hypothetical protein
MTEPRATCSTTGCERQVVFWIFGEPLCSRCYAEKFPPLGRA